MSESIVIRGLAPVQKLLGADFASALRAGLHGIAVEVENTIKPYGASGIWNSPSNPTGRWYERGYGPRWWTAGGPSESYAGKSRAGRRSEVLKAARQGRIGGVKTSEMLNRSWHVEQVGPLRYKVFSNASYAPALHKAGEQAGWAKRRGWLTDEQAVRAVVRSGRAKAILTAAVLARLRRR